MVSDFISFVPSQEGTTALILAAASGHLACVKELLRRGADPNRRRQVSQSQGRRTDRGGANTAWTGQTDSR